MVCKDFSYVFWPILPPPPRKKREKKERENRFCSRKRDHLSFGPTLACNGIIGAKWVLALFSVSQNTGEILVIAEKSTQHLFATLLEISVTCLSEMFTCVHFFSLQTMALIAWALLSALTLPVCTLTSSSQSDSVFWNVILRLAGLETYTIISV